MNGTMNRATTMSIRLASAIGPLVLQGDDDAITLLSLPDDSTSTSPAPDADEVDRLPTALAAAVLQLRQYFAGERRDFELPVRLSGTPFQRDVWRALGTIPYGTTVSYAELAAMVGRPAAFRAVGQANGANPVPIVLPCHRVLASGGKIGGYGGGLAMKRQLLELEGLHPPQ